MLRLGCRYRRIAFDGGVMVPDIRYGVLLAVGFALSACSTFSGQTETTGGIGPTTITADTTSAGQSISVGPASAGFGVATSTVTASSNLPPPILLLPPPPPPALVGSWRLARSGEASCQVDLSDRRVNGDLGARTRGCRDIGLSRVGSWAPSGDGVVLLDHDRQQLAALRPAGPRFFEGSARDGAGLTLWR